MTVLMQAEERAGDDAGQAALAEATAHARISAEPRAPAASTLYRRLHAAIVAMELRPGDPLGEADLAARFGGGRHRVREALWRLAEDGLVEQDPLTGAVVARISTDRISESVIVRKALEGVTVERAASGATPADIVRLDTIIDCQRRLAERHDFDGFHEADEAFHAEIATIAGHPGIWDFLRPAKIQIDRARRLSATHPGRPAQVIGEHRAIRDAIARHDGTAAGEAMRRHLGVVVLDTGLLRRRYPAYFA